MGQAAHRPVRAWLSKSPLRATMLMEHATACQDTMDHPVNWVRPLYTLHVYISEPTTYQT